MADDSQPSTIVVNPQAAWEQSVTAPTSSDTTKALSAPQVAEQASSAALTKDEIAGTAPKAAYDTGVAQLQADAAKNNEKIAGATLQEKSAVDEKQMANIAAKAEVLRQAQEAIKATPAPALFADRQGWQKVIGAIGIAIAGIGDAKEARDASILHRERGPSAVDSIISADLERQKANIKRLTDVQIMAKEGVKDAIQARELALAKVDMKGAALLNLAAQHAESLLKAKGVEAPAIQQNELVLKLRRDEETRKAAAVAGLTSEHTAASSKTETTNRISDPTPSAPTGRVAIVKNPDGSDAGLAPAAAANTVNEETAKRITVERTGREYLDFVKAHPHVMPGTAEYHKAEALHAEMVTALGSVSALGKSDETNALEAKRLGPSGTGVWSTQPALISKILDTNAKAGKTRIKLTAGTATEKDGSPKEMPAAPAPTPQTAAQGQTAPMVPPADQAAAAAKKPARAPNSPWTPEMRDAAKWITAHPGDPRIPEIRKRLGLP